jgi:hypothetical protein
VGRFEMPRQADLAGVAHNIAHHAASGLSWITPHLALALRDAGVETTEISLLSEQPYPPNVAESQPLRPGSVAMHGFVVSLLETHGFAVADVSSVVLRATPAPWDESSYSLRTHSHVDQGAHI